MHKSRCLLRIAYVLVKFGATGAPYKLMSLGGVSNCSLGIVPLLPLLILNVQQFFAYRIYVDWHRCAKVCIGYWYHQGPFFPRKIPLFIQCCFFLSNWFNKWISKVKSRLIYYRFSPLIAQWKCQSNLMIAHNKYKTYIHAYNQSKLFSDDDTYLKSSSTKSEKNPCKILNHFLIRKPRKCTILIARRFRVIREYIQTE